MSSSEINFDGLVGPTHNFAGLSQGNIASSNNAQDISNPKEAALQGLAKMHRLWQMGYAQAVLPPHERPHIPTLKRLGFTGSDARIIEQVAKSAPHILAAVSSASAMWVANAATISPAADTKDGRTHFTPANLSAMFHRSIEPAVTARILKQIFSDADHFTHHAPLPSLVQFGDEGAANHTRLCTDMAKPGIELFVYGAVAFDRKKLRPLRHPARQTLEASQAIARLHGLDDSTAIFTQQNPNVIDAGVFHNDVIAVGSHTCLFYHQDAFVGMSALKDAIRQRLPQVQFVEVPRDAVPLEDAVSSYLFNTQLLPLGITAKGKMRLLAPTECRENPRVHTYLQTLVQQQDSPIREVTYIDVRQSMKNGGGPACLRLRVALSEAARATITARVFMDQSLYDTLSHWVDTHYRDRLAPTDLADPDLLIECRTALDDLTRIMQLGSIYDFQRG